MSFPKTVTPRVEPHTLTDGSTIYTATLEELPGVVCDGPSAQAALSELLAVARDIARRLDCEFLGFNTPAVAQWRWTSYAGSQPSFEFGHDALAGQMAVEAGQGFALV